jgi:hypothetical protein
MWWTRQRFARDGIAGQIERFVSGQQHADERCCCGRRSRVVLTPRRWRQVRGRQVGPTGFRQAISAGDGGKRARSPGRARRKPLKPLRAGMPGDSGVLVYSCAFYQSKVHTRLRVQRASGIPHALCFSWAEDSRTTRAHRAARRERAFRRHCEERSDEAIHSFFTRRDGLLRCARNDGFLVSRLFEIESRTCAGGGALPLPPNSGLPELGISNYRSRIYPTSIGRGLG